MISLLWNNEHQSVFYQAYGTNIYTSMVIEKVEAEIDNGFPTGKWIIAASGRLPDMAFVFDIESVDGLRVGYIECGDPSKITNCDHIEFDEIGLVKFESLFIDENKSSVVLRARIRAVVTGNYTLWRNGGKS